MGLLFLINLSKSLFILIFQVCSFIIMKYYSSYLFGK